MMQAEGEEREDAPTGMPEGAPEIQPLGPAEDRPEDEGEGDGEPARGGEAMPGIPTEGEPPSGG